MEFNEILRDVWVWLDEKSAELDEMSSPADEVETLQQQIEELEVMGEKREREKERERERDRESGSYSLYMITYTCLIFPSHSSLL